METEPLFATSCFYNQNETMENVCLITQYRQRPLGSNYSCSWFYVMSSEIVRTLSIENLLRLDQLLDIVLNETRRVISLVNVKLVLDVSETVSLSIVRVWCDENCVVMRDSRGCLHTSCSCQYNCREYLHMFSFCQRMQQCYLCLW